MFQTIRLLAAFQRRLSKQFEKSHNSSVEQAGRYVNLIIDEIEYLADNTDSEKFISHIRKYYRCAKVKSHLISYRQTENNIEIEVIRVLHQRMDIDNRLNE